MSKKILACLVIMGLMSSMLVSLASAKDPIHLKYWYLWGGVEGDAMGKLCAAYNASQKDIVVEGLSVPDVQKQLVGMSSDDGPDVTDYFEDSIPNWADNGLILPLDGFAKQNGYSFTKDLSASAVHSMTYKGKIWAFPLGVNMMLLWYNKDHLKAAGIKNPPKTFSELLADSIKTTKVDSKGQINQMGFPHFPSVYYLNNFAACAGVKMATADNKPVVGDRAWYNAAKLWIDYQKKFGFSQVKNFESAFGGYVTASDPFIMGMQTFRIDGMWLPSFIDQYNKNLNYGVCAIPYMDGVPKARNSMMGSFSTLHIASHSKNPGAAFKFLKWLASPTTMIHYMAGLGQSYVPPQKVWPNNAEFKAMQQDANFKMSLKVAKTAILVNWPKASWSKDYTDTFKQLDAALDGDVSLDDAWAKLTAAQQKLSDKN